MIWFSNDVSPLDSSMANAVARSSVPTIALMRSIKRGNFSMISTGSEAPPLTQHAETSGSFCSRPSCEGASQTVTQTPTRSNRSVVRREVTAAPIASSTFADKKSRFSSLVSPLSGEIQKKHGQAAIKYLERALMIFLAPAVSSPKNDYDRIRTSRFQSSVAASANRQFPI